jgi:hypothetical protein
MVVECVHEHAKPMIKIHVILIVSANMTQT